MYEDSGYEMVLIFLVLSGFVIGINTKIQHTLSAIYTYLYKRFVRIYPIYVLSIFLAVIVGVNTYSFITVLSNLTFTNIFFSNIILENGPVWSLHYEVFFYLLFIPIFFFNLNSIKTGCFAFILGLVSYFSSPFIHLTSITSYCFGFSFWISGNIIAKYFIQKEEKPVNYNKLLSYLFMLITLPYFNIFSIAMDWATQFLLGKRIEYFYDGDVNHWFKNAFSFTSFSYWPYCFIGILIFINGKFKYKSIWLFCFQILPVFLIISLKMQSKLDLVKYFVPIVCYVLSCIFYVSSLNLLTKISTYCIDFLAWTGEISYAIYLFHIPILVIFNRIHFFSGSLFSFAVRIVLYLILTYLVAYYVEKKYQVYIKKWLFPVKMQQVHCSTT